MEECFDDVSGILNACEKINDISFDDIIKIRKFCSSKGDLQRYAQLYYQPYPIISAVEFSDIKDGTNAIKLVELLIEICYNYSIITTLEAEQ